VDRFQSAPVLPADADPADRLVRANEEIARLHARISALEQTVETETRLRLETGAMLAAERMRTRQLDDEPDRVGGSGVENGRAAAELEAAWSQIHQLRAALDRRSSRWWRRGRFS